MPRSVDHIYIAGTIVFTVYSQLIMRWQVSLAGALPTDLLGKMHFVAAAVPQSMGDFRHFRYPVGRYFMDVGHVSI